MLHLHRCGQTALGTSLNMDSQLKYGLVDHNHCTIGKDILDWNDPNADKWQIGSTYTNVMGVLGPSLSNVGISSMGSSPCSNHNCGKESTRWMDWQVV